jgi:hypothetical protein
MKRMTPPLLRSLPFVILPLVGGCGAATESSKPKDPPSAMSATKALAGSSKPTLDMEQARQELIRLEHAYSKALIAKDRAFLETYYAPDFRGGNWMGFWTKSTMLKAVLDDRYSVRSMDLSNLNVKIVGSIGIVQGVSAEVSRVNGKDTSGRWSFTDVFELRSSRWVATASHTSELKPE